jgi:hypothetical protein
MPSLYDRTKLLQFTISVLFSRSHAGIAQIFIKVNCTSMIIFKNIIREEILKKEYQCSLRQ